MKRDVLVPLDGSEIALRALEHALDRAKRDGATVHVLNVEPEFDGYGMIPAHMTEKAQHDFTEAEAHEKLEPGVRLAKALGVPCKAHVAWGDPAKVTAQKARELECAAIVMGTRGMSAAGNLLLGSVATDVIHHAEVPVTLVK